MLGLCKRVNFCAFHYFTIASVAISTLSVPASCAVEYLDEVQSVKNNHEFEWVIRYFNSLDDDTPIDEVVDFIVNLRDALEAKGYQVPSLGDFCLKIGEDLIEKGVDLDDGVVEDLCRKFMQKDSCYINVVPAKNPLKSVSKPDFLNIKSSKKKDSGIKMSEGTAKGFMKTFAGALLCIIPHPVAWGVGGALIASGINDMVKHAGDPIEGESAEEKIKNLPPPAEKEK